MLTKTSTLSLNEISDIKARHPNAFERSLFERFRAPLAIGLVVLYSIYCMWFFSISKVIENGNWNIAGAYLADWVSYEVRPDIDYRTGEIEIDFPRFSPLGDNPEPEWIETETGSVTIRKKTVVKAPAASNNGGINFMAKPKEPAPAKDDGAVSFMAPKSDATNTGTKEETEITIETREGVAEAVVDFGDVATLSITPKTVIVEKDGQTLTLFVDPVAETVTHDGDLPDWALQKRENEKIFLNFGFAGRAEVRDKEVKIYRRFMGWENFFFDTQSPFWGQSFGSVVSAVFTGERVDPDRSNISVMWDNLVSNAEWQHGDVWLKLLQTIVMAFVGTVLAVLVAFPLSFIAARNITPNRVINQILKRFFDFLRSVDMLIWALFFTRAFGPGPISGIAAIFFTDTGTFGKLYSEALENIDDKQREGIKSVGAAPAAVQRYGVVPQVLPVFLSQALYFWESNTRSATIIGAVGAGGIGLKLWEAIRTNQDWENVAYMVVLILIVVFVFDAVSNKLRMRLIGKSAN